MLTSFPLWDSELGSDLRCPVAWRSQQGECPALVQWACLCNQLGGNLETSSSGSNPRTIHGGLLSGRVLDQVC